MDSSVGSARRLSASARTLSLRKKTARGTTFFASGCRKKIGHPNPAIRHVLLAAVNLVEHRQQRIERVEVQNDGVRQGKKVLFLVVLGASGPRVLSRLQGQPLAAADNGTFLVDNACVVHQEEAVCIGLPSCCHRLAQGAGQLSQGLCDGVSLHGEDGEVHLATTTAARLTGEGLRGFCDSLGKEGVDLGPERLE